MTTIQIQDNGVTAALAELQRRCAHLQPVMDAIGTEIQARVTYGFEHEQSPDGINWAALSPSTLRKRGANAEKLRDKGSMFASLGHNATDNAVEITIGQDYAPHHQFGTSKMPARPFFPSANLPEDWQRNVMDILSSYIMPTT